MVPLRRHARGVLLMAKPVHDKPINIRAWQSAAGKGDTPLSADQFGGGDDFDLPSDREAYYKGLGVGLEKSVEVQNARKEAAKAARVAKPKAAPAPRQPRPVNPVKQAQSRVARIGKLARMASGKRR
jgi:hypothetical protein